MASSPSAANANGKAKTRAKTQFASKAFTAPLRVALCCRITRMPMAFMPRPKTACCAFAYPKPRLRNPNPWRSRFIESARKAGLWYFSAGSAGARSLARAARAYGSRGRFRGAPRNIMGERIMINSSTAPYAALILRLSLGILFLAHVALKIFVFTIPGFVGYFASLGLPPILAYGVIALELLGGIALILGIYASWIAVPLALEMLGSIFLVHGANGWLFTNKGGGWEYPAFWAVSLAILYLLGDGTMALRPVGRKT